jgi:hypothetical protein
MSSGMFCVNKDQKCRCMKCGRGKAIGRPPGRYSLNTKEIRTYVALYYVPISVLKLLRTRFYFTSYHEGCVSLCRLESAL